MGQRIILAGATGLIGSAAVPLLVTAGFDVHILLRSPVSAIDGVTAHVALPDQWPRLISQIAADTAVSCLGTTMRAAGSQAAFAAVDLVLVSAFAAAAKAAGADQFIAVSSVGANAASSNFYLKTKGQMEADIGALGFERADFLRPGLLRGERAGMPRYGERLGIMLSPLADLLLMGPLQRYRSIAAGDVAAAISRLASLSGARTRIYENEAILELGKESV